jgi:hypothetical protein
VSFGMRLRPHCEAHELRKRENMKKLIIALCLCATPAMAREPYRVPVNPPKCETVIVKSVTHADPLDPADPSFTGNERCGGCSSGILYTNGKGQRGEYSLVPGMERSRPGDRVRLCLVSYLAGCPKGDNRGHEYVATNLRTHMTWKRNDAMHMCGGA